MFSTGTGGACFEIATYAAPMGLRLSLVAVLTLLSCAAACAGDPEEPTDDTIEQAADELNLSLRNYAVVKATMTESGTITVAYEPGLYNHAALRVPFLAIELPAQLEATSKSDTAIKPANTATRVAVTVAGDFPGAPQLVVTDANFTPLASVRGRKTDLGGEATVHVTPNRGKFVLVRDRLWVKPMTFQVTVGQ